MTLPGINGTYDKRRCMSLKTKTGAAAALATPDKMSHLLVVKKNVRLYV
jgi:hypothetical protein